jgi:hypothetical protein
MVHIKFTARPRISIVSPKFASMSLRDATKVSAEHRKTLAGQLDESLVSEWAVISTEAASEKGAMSDREDQSDGSGDSKTASDNVERVKIRATAALAGLRYDFGQSTVTNAYLASLESFAHYFPKAYGRPPGAESVLVPREDEAVVFEDFFVASLRMPPHPVHLDILHKFQVQLHQLTPNGVVQISKFI